MTCQTLATDSMGVGASEEAREYVQLFVYRVPKSNRESLRKVLKAIVAKLKEHGLLGSDFYQLHSSEAFQGFTTIANTFSSSLEEELWVELDHYRDRRHRDQVMASLSKDPGAGGLFKQLGPLVSERYSIVMGEFDGMSL